MRGVASDRAAPEGPPVCSDQDDIMSEAIHARNLTVAPAPREGRGKVSRAHGGCLGAGSRRRARQAAIVPGEAHTAFDPGVPEWGNPRGVDPARPHLNEIGCAAATGGTETSQYPEEEKSTEIPGVAASETGPAQTGERLERKGVAPPGLRGTASGGLLPPAR